MSKEEFFKRIYYLLLAYFIFVVLKYSVSILLPLLMLKQ